VRPLCLDYMCFQVVQPAVQLKKPHVLWQSDGSLWMLLLVLLAGYFRRFTSGRGGCQETLHHQ
jgi:hypothetical protein